MCAEPHALTRAHKYTHTKKTEKCLNVIAHAYIKIPVKKTKKKQGGVCLSTDTHQHIWDTANAAPFLPSQKSQHAHP